MKLNKIRNNNKEIIQEKRGIIIFFLIIICFFIIKIIKINFIFNPKILKTMNLYNFA